MKRVIALVGLAALGVSSVQSLCAADGPKPWSVSASLRGFYDDNPNTAPDGPGRKGSFGFDVSPSVTLALPLEQTSIYLSYTYSARYYDKAFLNTANNNEHWSHSHMFNATLDHNFSERYHLNVRDSFVIGQEPDTLRSGSALTSFQRVSGENIVNSSSITFTAAVTPLLDIEVGYANVFVDYEDRGATFDFLGNLVSASRSGLLDRLEHTFHIETDWNVQPTTALIVGYRYGQVDYTGDEVIAGNINAVSFKSDVRNLRSQDGYVGAKHTFNPDLTGSLRVGASYADSYNSPTHDTSVAPTANANLNYTYGMGSYLDAGFTYSRNATDLVGTGGTNLTSFAESAVLYVSLNHQITPKLRGTVLVQFQQSTYHGGSFNSVTDYYYLAGLNFSYSFTRYLSAELGYNYDKLDSGVSKRSFDRNRVYTGITATF